MIMIMRMIFRHLIVSIKLRFSGAFPNREPRGDAEDGQRYTADVTKG